MFDFKKIKKVVEKIINFYFVYPFIFIVDLFMARNEIFAFWRHKKRVLIYFYGSWRYGFLTGVTYITYIFIPLLVLAIDFFQVYMYKEIIDSILYIFFSFNIVILLIISKAYVFFKNIET